jgi:hypothetical protein
MSFRLCKRGPAQGRTMVLTMDADTPGTATLQREQVGGRIELHVPSGSRGLHRVPVGR